MGVSASRLGTPALGMLLAAAFAAVQPAAHAQPVVPWFKQTAALAAQAIRGRGAN